jgi:hypothetical protein
MPTSKAKKRTRLGAATIGRRGIETAIANGVVHASLTAEKIARIAIAIGARPIPGATAVRSAIVARKFLSNRSP